MSSSSMDASAVFDDPVVASLFSGMLSERRIRLADVRGPEKAGGSLSSSTIVFVVDSSVESWKKCVCAFRGLNTARLLEIFLVLAVVFVDGGERFCVLIVLPLTVL